MRNIGRMNLLFLWLLFTITACAGIQEQISTSTPQYDLTYPPTSTVLPTFTTSPTFLPTVPASSPTITDTVAQIPADTLTPTWTPPPTLEPEQAQEILKTWLQGTETCLAPCFWNIIPGQTPMDEAINIFAHLGLQTKNTTQDNIDFYGIAYDFESGLSFRVILTVQDGIVINLRVKIVPAENNAEVLREWLAYSPEMLISQYGPPSQVNFFIGRNRDNDASSSIWYDMVLYFETVDLIVLYNGSPMQKPTSLLHICPLIDSFAGVQIFLGKNPQYPPSEGVPLEAAASMTIEEFAALMKGDHENACFDINDELFP